MKTTDLLTFFHPTESRGNSWTFPVRNSDGLVAQFWVFTRGDEDLSRFANSTVSTPEEFEILYNDLRGVIQKHGGIVVYAGDHNDLVKIQLYRVAAPGYAPPESLLRLRAFGDALPEKITGKVDLEVGDHLLLPVSKDAEARLSALRDDLKGLPSDLESSILNIIRRPSLEWRLERIERTLSMPPATQAEQQRSRVGKGNWWEKLRGLIIRPIPAWTAVASSLLLMVGTLAYGSFHPLNQVEKKAEKETAPETVKPTPEPKPPKIEPGDLKASLDALFKALSTTDDQAVKGIYESHFKDHQEDAFKNPDVSWGITKLQALKLGFIDKNHPTFKLNDRLAWSDTEKAYRDEKNLSSLKKSEDAVDLLAYTWCQQNNAPALPVTPKYNKSLQLKGSCSDVKPEDAVPGLEALTKWVKEQHK